MRSIAITLLSVTMTLAATAEGMESDHSPDPDHESVGV